MIIVVVVVLSHAMIYRLLCLFIEYIVFLYFSVICVYCVTILYAALLRIKEINKCIKK